MKASKLIFGVALILLGVYLWGRAADWFYFSFGDVIQFLFPVGLIFLGIWLIIRRKQQEDRMEAEIHIHSTPPPPPPPGGPEAGSSSEHHFTADASETADDTRHTFNYDSRASHRPEMGSGGGLKFSKAFGDMMVDCNGLNLKSIEISSGVGDLEIMLKGGQLTRGLNRMVVSGFVGDIRVFVPKEMPYLTHCSNSVGDIDIAGRRSSGFGNNVDSQSEDYDQAESKLYLAVNSFVGDLRIYIV